jgi:PEP-CTERM motif-containing protein
MTTRQNLAPLCALAAALAAGPLAPRADAGLILSSDNGAYIAAYPANSGRILGQQFTLNQDTTVSDVSAELDGLFGPVGPSGLTMQIYSDSSNTLGSLLDTSANPTSAVGKGVFSDIDFVFTGGASLAEGTYWMVLNNTNALNPGVVSWLDQSSATDSDSNAAGSINSLFYALGKYTPSAPLMMNLNGTYATAVPEPASLTLIVSGLGVVALLARRRRKARAGSSAICPP